MHDDRAARAEHRVCLYMLIFVPQQRLEVVTHGESAVAPEVLTIEDTSKFVWEDLLPRTSSAAYLSSQLLWHLDARFDDMWLCF